MTGDNILIIQSGGSTPVLNRSLYGLVSEAYEQKCFGMIYGAIHGIEGLLSNKFIDLSKQTKEQWNRIIRTPGAILGSSRRKLKTDDTLTALGILQTHGIRYCFIIGGNDSAETGHQISVATKAAGKPLTVINVPKTIDNDLVQTDHSPGYGSAARFVALATMGAGRDAETMGDASPITIIEVMGRNAGWLAASSMLAKQDERDAPHLVCVPEVPIDEQKFLNNVEDAYSRFGFVVVVVAENTRSTNGVLSNQKTPWYVDEFGHPYYDGAGRYLSELIGCHLKTRVRYERPGTIQRSMATCVSNTDALEAEKVGRAAVRYAIDGLSDHMVTLVRHKSKKYTCSTGLAPLERIAGQVSQMPGKYLHPADYTVTQAFVQYSTPLIGAPLPKFSRLL